jgi:hypothetical protein
MQPNWSLRTTQVAENDPAYCITYLSVSTRNNLSRQFPDDLIILGPYYSVSSKEEAERTPHHLLHSTVGTESLCRCRRKIRKFKVLYLGSKKSKKDTVFSIWRSMGWGFSR